MNTKPSLKLPHDYLHKLHQQAQVLRISTQANKCKAQVSSLNKLHQQAQVLSVPKPTNVQHNFIQINFATRLLITKQTIK